jgi:signal transduction histidine kinase
VRGGGDDIVVEVGDDGCGFDPDAVPTERLGVRVSILERVASVGGAAVIDTALGEGTVVALHWPVPKVSKGPTTTEVPS